MKATCQAPGCTWFVERIGVLYEGPPDEIANTLVLLHSDHAAREALKGYNPALHQPVLE